MLDSMVPSVSTMLSIPDISFINWSCWASLIGAAAPPKPTSEPLSNAAAAAKPTYAKINANLHGANKPAPAYALARMVVHGEH